MPRQLPSKIVEAMTKPQTNLLLLALLMIKHAGKELKFVNNSQAVFRTDGVWQPFPFSVSLPADGNNQVPTLSANIINISLEVSAFTRKAVGGEYLMKADLFIVDFDVPNTNLLIYENYDILNIQYNKNRLSFEMRLYYTLDMAFARYTLRTSAFPAIFGLCDKNIEHINVQRHCNIVNTSYIKKLAQEPIQKLGAKSMNQDDNKQQKEAAKIWAVLLLFPFSLPWIIAATKDKKDKPKKDLPEVSTKTTCIFMAAIMIFLVLMVVCST